MRIYDFGMNAGTNLAYYLGKGATVIAVEANPALCEDVRARFSDEIRGGRLVIVNAALAEEDASSVTFYIHKTNHVLSQLPRPPDPDQFTPIDMACRTPASIVQQFGEPSYIKVDVEHFDGAIL